jgi:hypothetical protein
MRGEGGGGCGVSANEYSCTHRSPNKLWRSNSIFYLYEWVPLPTYKQFPEFPPDWSKVGALVIVILGRSPRLPCCTDRILAINFSDRLPPLSELDAGSSQLEPRLPTRSITLELRRGRAAPGVPPELRRDESSEACDSVLELRRSRLPCDVAPEVALKAAAAAARTMASFDTSSMSASICSPVVVGTCVSQ